MPTATKQRPALFQEGDIAALDPKLQRLMQNCGINGLPPVHTRHIPLERIVVLDDARVKPSARFVRNIGLIGIRQPPSVAFLSGTAWDSEDASYVVVMGRRRVVSARRLLAKGDTRFTTIKCEVYEQHLPRLNAFLGLVENDQRSESWIQDVVSLRQLIGEGVAMTLDDLAQYGFSRKTIKARLDIALLPHAILDQICAGMVNLKTAMQITHLKETERERLNTLIAEGEELTPDLVKRLFKRQVNEGLACVHLHLSQAWATLPNERHVIPASATRSDSSVSISHLLLLLRQFEAQTRTDASLLRAGTLTQVLIKELEIALRH